MKDLLIPEEVSVKGGASISSSRTWGGATAASQPCRHESTTTSCTRTSRFLLEPRSGEPTGPGDHYRLWTYLLPNHNSLPANQTAGWKRRGGATSLRLRRFNNHQPQ